MNILVIGKYYNEGFALHIAESLVEMGFSVSRYEPGYRSGRINLPFGHRLDQVFGTIYQIASNMPVVRSQSIKGLWDIAGGSKFDLVIVCHDFLWPNEVTHLKILTAAPVVMWFPDHIANFGRGYFINAPYDGLFFKDPYIIYRLKEILKSPCYYLPECFNPKRHWLPEENITYDSMYKCDITTAGNLHAWRVAYFKNLSGYDIKLWGRPAPLWLDVGEVRKMYQGRSVFNHEKVLAFRGAKIVINNLYYGEVLGVNVRCFEAAGAGAFQMVDWRPNINELFQNGKELITFKSIDDLRSCINYWLPRDDERREVAKNGMSRAHKEHTYAHRIALMISTVAGKESGYPYSINAGSGV